MMIGMNRGYKKSYLIINTVLVTCILIALINFFVFKVTSFYYAFFVTLIPFLILYFNLGYEKKKRRFTYETLFYTFTYVVLFLIISYIIGIFVGFTQNVYHLNWSNITQNVIPYIVVIFSSELLRYEVVRKGDGSILSYILVTFLFIAIDATLFRNTYDLIQYDGLIKYICLIIFPNIFKNILMVFLCRNGGPHPCILYRLLMDLRIFIIPILPDFGMYFDSLVYTCVPVIIGAFIFISLKQFKNKEATNQKIKNTKMYKYITISVLLIITIGINLLTSCRFKYAMIAIGSDSMNPYIQKGDAVVYENNTDPNYYNYGDILVFRKDNRVVVHRIIDIIDINGEKIFYTKGDNNNGPDGYPITSKDIIGKSKYRVKYVGIFSVYLKEMIKS